MAPAPKPPISDPTAGPRGISRAPAPPPPVNPGTRKTVDWRSDEATDAEFDAGFNEMMQKRHARR